MACAVEYTDEFEAWWTELTEDEQESVAAYVHLLEVKGIALGSPHSSDIRGSKHGHMRELRIQHGGDPYRVFYAFDPRRAAMLLIGGCKSGHDRFYEEYIPQADRIYDAHLETLRKEAVEAAKPKLRR
jgi:hypothetical protein